ncbi:hypothetical protein EIN_021170 [Entamoeba invadens IP1]|uniref:hypothetical protein n=1 Tax=Entamoeba invadens IP1 TaxID=370355 RepID=UPI0002C3E70D|nr:hypothetical protein EIN_021170 [Entamoeba invadens IP1]ELP90608.1 hypothetical protein EIN_021170 [Entamoeba invadens IP1]|eukprot:XP_004257379.1 hypothetical protein EIN_021170 [Entamoeba invadens IP1]
MDHVDHPKSCSGRYHMMMDKYGKRGKMMVAVGFIFFSIIIPSVFGYAIWRPLTLIHAFTPTASREIYLGAAFVFWVLFNVKVFEELLYCRELLVLSAFVLDICMVPTSALPFVVLYDLMRCVLTTLFSVRLSDMVNQVLGFSILGIALFLCVLGFYRGTHISIERIFLKSSKVKRPIKFVQISDVHIGSRLDALPVKMVDKIIKENPDFVVITGDLIDSHNVEPMDLNEFDKLRKCGIPVYYSIGNHDLWAGEEYVSELLKYYGIVYLKNRVETIRLKDDEIQFVGIDDVQRVKDFNTIFESVEPHIEDGKYTILLHHRPLGYKTVVKTGKVDLQLAGHTHNGQIFPFNMFIKFFHSKACGLFNITSGDNRLVLYTHPGSCAWGPHFRTSSKNLITVFTLSSE